MTGTVQHSAAGTVYPTAGSVDDGIVRYAFGDRVTGNVSTQVGHADPEAVAWTAARVGLDRTQTVRMRQVHGRDVEHASTAHAGSWVPGTADGMVTTERGLGLMVSTADCVPLLLAAPGAVGAVHAGRDGVRLNVAAAAVVALEDVTGHPPERFTAIIGPAVGGCCYEVGRDLYQQVVDHVGATAAQTTWGTPSLDLPAGVSAQLDTAGVGRIAAAGGCTRCNTDRWFSHRATTSDGAAAGRQAAIIVLDPPADHAAPPRADETSSLD